MTAPRITAEEMPDDEIVRRIMNASRRSGYVDFDQEDISEGDKEIVRELVRDIREDFRSELNRLSAQGGEIPAMSGREAELELSAFLEDFEGDRSEAYTKGMYYGIQWARERIRPAPPHPDTVERDLSVEELDAVDALRALGYEDCAKTLHDALRAQAQPATALAMAEEEACIVEAFGKFPLGTVHVGMNFIVSDILPDEKESA